MSELELAMEKHIAKIVHCENRPFSHFDFLRFEVEGKEYRMTHGTYRNKIAALKRAGKVELAYNSGIAFYTLKGKRFGKPMTSNHKGVFNSKMDSFSRLISDLPTEGAALHDIRLKFQVKGIWSKISSLYPHLPVIAVSQDIRVRTWNFGELLVRTIIHKSDTVSVIIACSLAPVTVSINGLIYFSNALTRVEERLNVMLNGTDFLYGTINGSGNDNDTSNPKIPNHSDWVVAMWHFGADSLVEFAGEKFEITWGNGKNVLIRVYTKVMKDKKTRIRLERQECPNKTLPEIIQEKINAASLP